MVKEEIRSKLDSAMEDLRCTEEGFQNRRTAYAFIKTLLDMGGTNIPFMAICDKMGESYPYSRYPSYVVHVFKLYGIVSNTGSNKHPKWSLPADSIDAISKAIEKYR